MGPSSDVFNTQFRPTLDKKLLNLQYPLPDIERDRIASWNELLAETEESLAKRSRQRRSVRLRARYFANKVYSINTELFILCTLSYSISGLPTIVSELFYSQLKEWWLSKPANKLLSKITQEIDPKPTKSDGDIKNLPLLSSPIEKGEEYRTSESQVHGTSALGAKQTQM